MKKLLSFILPMFILASCVTNNSQSSSNDTNGISNQTINPGDNNVLVAYFSVTNNTKKLANYAKDYLNSDIFEIVPTQEYTSADIDYNSDCRANREQNDDETVLLVDSWINQEALDKHHELPLMNKIKELRDKYDLHMEVEKYQPIIDDKDKKYIRR